MFAPKSWRLPNSSFLPDLKLSSFICSVQVGQPNDTRQCTTCPMKGRRLSWTTLLVVFYADDINRVLFLRVTRALIKGIIQDVCTCLDLNPEEKLCSTVFELRPGEVSLRHTHALTHTSKSFAVQAHYMLREWTSREKRRAEHDSSMATHR